MMKKCVVVPTYWGPINAGEEIVFDHPTALNDKGTLKTLLDNLLTFEEIRNGKIPVRIVGVANKRDIRAEVEIILEKYIQPYEHQMAIELYSYKKLSERYAALEAKGIKKELLEPDSYSQIRNICLLAALETGSDIGIFLDDDEILIDENFFELASDGIYEHADDNGIIYGKVGYYEQDRPSYKNFWELKHWPKDISFNETFEMLMDPKSRFKPSMVGLGGNMVITKEMMKAICFDPLVNRGEDMDYVLDARFRGYRFYFDNKLRIKHLPPEKKTPMWKKSREDIYRFLFMRDKYNSSATFDKFQKVDYREMLPYPGVFLADDLEDRIFEHNKQLGLKHLSENDTRGFEECMENAKIPFVYEKREDASELYYKCLEEWWKITEEF
jgi:hypothetical protein